MAERRKKPEETPVDVVEEVKEEETQTAPAPEFVSLEEYDRAVKHLSNEIGDLKVRLDDLENVVSAPQGSVVFSEVTQDIPDYGQPALPVEDTGDTPEAEWYRPGYLQ